MAVGNMAIPLVAVRRVTVGRVAVEALAMGAPLVAIKGGCTAARMSTSLVQGVGRPEWVAQTPAEFASIVADLCADLPALRAGKRERQQQAQNSLLFDGIDLAHHLQEALIAMARHDKRS
jgi:predicted O-linked N-acetylglucosamine transferase (SPINDLY family)